MRRTFAILALAAGVATSAQAQKAWQTEIGIQGGFTRIVAAGMGSDPFDQVSLPGFNLGPALPGAAGIYAIIPWRNKIAVEVDVAASQLTAGGSATMLSLGLRGDYALTNQFYAAAGGNISYVNGLENETQLGVQAAVGYHRRLTGPLNARLEARATLWGAAETIGAQNAYSVLFGVSTATGRARAARSASRGRTGGAWTKQFGVAGGYANVHEVGGGIDLSTVALPGHGGGLAVLGGPTLTLPPTVFVIFPVGNKIAIEPGIDINRFQSGGTTEFYGNLSARVNYAVMGGWYAALGGNLHYIKVTGLDAATRTGLNVAWGNRFDLTGPLGGRVELNYTMFGRQQDLGLAPTNTTGLMFAITVPLQ